MNRPTQAHRIARLLATAAVLTLPFAIASPAQAKGERGRVMISGPALGSAITLRHGDAFTYIEGSGWYQAKWDAPNINGRLQPAADLGPAYDAIFTLGPECPGERVAQTLFPYAPGGPQIFTGAGQALCGMEPPAGYWPAPVGLLRMLVERGLPPAEAARSVAPSAAPTGAVSIGDGSAPTGGGRWAVAAAVTLVVGAVVASAVFSRSRRRPALG